MPLDSRYTQVGFNSISVQVCAPLDVLPIIISPLQQADNEALTRFSKRMLHGSGSDRWFDKSFCAVVTADAKIGFNIEHSWSDAPIMFHFTEYLEHRDINQLGYDADGNCWGDVQTGLATPTLLR